MYVADHGDFVIHRADCPFAVVVEQREEISEDECTALQAGRDDLTYRNCPHCLPWKPEDGSEDA